MGSFPSISSGLKFYNRSSYITPNEVQSKQVIGSKKVSKAIPLTGHGDP
jgi:hypothetical protein